METDNFAMLRGKQILVVEDEHLIALSLADELEAAGAVVVGPTSSLAGALDLIGSAALDGAVLDIQLAGEACFPAADLLIASATPLLFTTGYDVESVPAAYAGISCVLKPVAPSTVLQTLTRLL